MYKRNHCGFFFFFFFFFFYFYLHLNKKWHVQNYSYPLQIVTVYVKIQITIVAAHNSGKGYKAISKCFQGPVATVQSIIKKYRTFHTEENLRGCGQKPKVTPVLARSIMREVIRIKAILVNLGSAGGNVSRQPVQCTLHTAGFHGRRPRRMPLLQIRHTKAYLAFANAHLDKEEDSWCSVLWSNETKMFRFVWPQ